MAGVNIPRGSNIEETKLRIPLFVNFASFFTDLNIKVSLSISHDIPSALSIRCGERSKFTNLGESSEEGRDFKICSELDNHFVSLKPHLSNADIIDNATF